MTTRGFMSTSSYTLPSSTGKRIPYTPVAFDVPTIAKIDTPQQTPYAASVVAQVTKSPKSTTMYMGLVESAKTGYASALKPYVKPEVQYAKFQAEKDVAIASIPENAAAVENVRPTTYVPGIPYVGLSSSGAAVPITITQPSIVSVEQGYTGRTVYAPTYQFLKDLLESDPDFYNVDIDNLVLARENGVPVSQVVSSKLSQGRMGSYQRQIGIKGWR